jgi:hypothetical protein
MHTIWKFPVQPSNFTLDLPIGATFLSVQVQHRSPQCWFLLDPEAPKVTRRFVLLGTGHSVPEPRKLTHRGTFQIREGQLVFHLFEYDAPGY